MHSISRNISTKETMYVNQSEYQYERDNVHRISFDVNMTPNDLIRDPGTVAEDMMK